MKIKFELVDGYSSLTDDTGALDSDTYFYSQHKTVDTLMLWRVSLNISLPLDS